MLSPTHILDKLKEMEVARYCAHKVREALRRIRVMEEERTKTTMQLHGATVLERIDDVTANEQMDETISPKRQLRRLREMEATRYHAQEAREGIEGKLCGSSLSRSTDYDQPDAHHLW